MKENNTHEEEKSADAGGDEMNDAQNSAQIKKNNSR